jgi:AMMECR1 domain-containing protein
MKVEDPVISALVNPDYIGVISRGQGTSIDSVPLLGGMAYLAKSRNLNGVVTCYTDSSDRHHVYTSTNKKHVSYLSMVYLTDLIITQSQQKMLVSYALSIVTSKLTNSEMPYFPSWSIYQHMTNGAFVGIQNANGNTRASVGRYEDGETVAEHVRNSTLDTFDDAPKRWGSPLSVDELQGLNVYVNILSPKNKWETLTVDGLLQRKIQASDGFGFYLTLANGAKSTYLPSVWLDNPGWTIEDILTTLAGKALGMKGSEAWREGGVSVALYTTHKIEGCQS